MLGSARTVKHSFCMWLLHVSGAFLGSERNHLESEQSLNMAKLQVIHQPSSLPCFAGYKQVSMTSLDKGEEN